MKPFRARMLTSTVIPLAMAVGVGIAGASIAGAAFAACRPCAPKRGCNPCAAKKGCNPCAAKKGCNPCAAKKGCNPCAAKKKGCGACYPCKAKSACGACSPCGPGGGNFSKKCVIPRLAAAKCNPCAAKKGCNPCGAKKGCNPCGAKKGCGPCAAKKGCNPCAAKKKGCGPCNPCNPCGGAAAAKLTEAEAAKAYDCLLGEMRAGYGKSKSPMAKNYLNFRRYSRVAYQSATHGGRYVQNYANEYGKAYGAYEKAGTLPVGTLLAKDSFSAAPGGKLGIGPLFLMQKMSAGFNKAARDWKYSMIMPDGKIFGVTGGKNSKGMNFCYECHNGVAPDQDSVMLVPDEFRVK